MKQQLPLISEDSRAHSLLSAFGDPDQEEQAHQQMVEEVRDFMDKFSAYCLTSLNENNSNKPLAKGLKLVAATHINDIGTIRCLLENYDRSYEEYGPIAAMQAAGSGYFEIVQLLFERYPHWFDSHQSKLAFLVYPFHLAAINKHREIVEYLLPHTSTAIINASGKNMLGATFPPLLIGLVKSDCMEILRLVLTRKPDLEVRSSDGHTPLSQACSSCNYDIAQMLIEAGAKVDISTTISKGQAPKESSNARISANPMANLVSIFTGETGITTTPLEFAAANGHVRLVYLLLKSGARVNVAPSMLGSALMLAARASTLDPALKHFKRDFPNVVRLLLMHNATVDERHPFSNETPLLSACIANQSENVNQLLLAGADVNVQSNLGEKVTTFLDKMGINWQPKTSSNPKTAQMLLRAQKSRKQQLLEQENQLRKELIEALSTGKYNSNLDKEPSHPKLELLPKDETEKSVASTTKKKKKKKKNKKKKLIAHDDNNIASSETEQVANKAPDDSTTAEILNQTPEKSVTVTEQYSTETFVPVPSPSKTLDTQPNPPIHTVTDLQPSVAFKIPKPLFDASIPTGDKLRTFPLRFAGLQQVFYYVALIPDELNKHFDSSHLPQLRKMWAAILTERLLPAKSKNTAGVKCLAVQEMSKLKCGFFKKATHKVKHPREDTRVYLQSTLPKNNSTNEIHLELIAPDFRAHK